MPNFLSSPTPPAPLPGFHSATPVIVDEAYESPETVTLRYEEACAGGSLGRSDSLAGFLPMSAYGKPPPPHLQGFDTNRSFSDPAYAYPAAPQHASQPPPHASPFQNAPEMAQVSYGSHATRGSYDEQAGSYAPFNSNPTPASIRVTSRQPPRGLPGSKLDVYVSSVYELMTTSLESVSLMFGQQKCPASLMRYEQQSRDYQYIVSTEVPQIAVEAWESAEVPLFLLIENAEGELVEKVDVGPFTYERGRLGSDAESLKSTERSSSLKQLGSPDERIWVLLSPGDAPARRHSQPPQRPGLHGPPEYMVDGRDPVETADPAVQAVAVRKHNQHPREAGDARGASAALDLHQLHPVGGQEPVLRNERGHHLPARVHHGAEVPDGGEEPHPPQPGALQAADGQEAHPGQPKPRNIEKDIKVFAWKSLSNALRKITSKYSVKSGSSQPQASLPPPTLLTPVSSTGYADSSTTATYGQPTDRNGMFSPRSSTRSMSGASTHPPPFAGIPARLNSPPYNHLNPIKGENPNHSSGAPDLRAQLPLFADTTNSHSHSSHPSAAGGPQWSAPPQQQHHMPAPLQQYTPRSSWDLTAAAAGGYADPQAASQGSAVAGAVTAAGGIANVLQRPPTTQMPLSPLRSRGRLEEGGVKEERRGSLQSQALRS
ncbi:hypothetical protein V502_07502 [Pseudogymnoascus sp. VKM F-4520 (FW-2644)]|nr:hypothetical protein V502_07502 [Pseudogymnoascus sp. VKM F-4520 (FW-2644)]